MMYNNNEYPHYIKTAGKVTVVAALAAVLVFLFAWSFDAGTQELQRVSAQQTATTSLTVLNTPPYFIQNAHEATESSTSSPTNSGDQVTWTAVAEDSNGAPYFLLICDTNTPPQANSAPDVGSLGTVQPQCGTGATQWAVSTSTLSGAVATAATTTLESFAEQNVWYAWVCDDDPNSAQCNATAVQGISATNSSPFFVNHRPSFSSFTNNGPIDPGATITFSSVSSDPDTVASQDRVTLVVCQGAGDYNTVTNTCSANFISSTTVLAASNATAEYTLASIVRDGTFPAHGFIVDEHGHESASNPISQSFDVNNVAPYVLGGQINLNDGADLYLTELGGETTGFTLDFTIADNNSCENAASGDEITGYSVALFRSSYGTSTCNPATAAYNPNYCYTSSVPAAQWNLTCTASTTSCTGPTDADVVYSCTFPLWFIADPTDPGAPASFAADTWIAAVAGVDDNNATGTLTYTSNPRELFSFLGMNLLTADIPYGALAPGDNSGTLNATTTIASAGNTGLDQEVIGDHMCPGYLPGSPCSISPTSTIPAANQQFSSTSLAYNAVGVLTLDPAIENEVELNVPKTTSTSTPTTGTTYWGIEVPASIMLSGNYYGMNTFTAVVAEHADW